MSQRLLRVIRMVELIRQQRYPTVDRLCDLFQIKKRTALEDISFIKRELKLDIKFDRIRGGYYDSNPGKELPKMDLTDEELFCLRLSSQSLTKQSNGSFEITLESALNKIDQRVPTPEEDSGNRPCPQVLFHQATIKKFPTRLFNDLHKACTESILTTITYKSAYTGQTLIREIEPYRVLVNNGSWYLIAYCCLRQSTRLFALHRIEKHELHDKRFPARPDFDVNLWLQSSFQIEHGDSLNQVKIRFSAKAAVYLQEKRWHPNQKHHEHNDGSYTLTVPSANLNEVKRWVLYYGAAAEVLEPKSLRDMVGAEARAMALLYGSADC